MGSFSSWSYTSTLTIWPVTLDEFSQPLVGEPYSVRGTWVRGGPAMRDDDGIEFVPAGRFWFESDRSPSRQWYITDGEFTGNPPDGAELIRVVTAYDISQFEAGSLTDYMAAT